MELQNQIRKHRTGLNLSQEDLAEKVYVTRQTVSNWENGKSYPDIHSLLLLSSLFNISLDQLIKGDIEIMKKEINAAEVEKHNRYGNIFAILFLVCLISFVPLVKFLKIYGFIIWLILWAIGLFWGFKVRNIQKQNNISTYKEIVAFSEGKMLDEIEQQKEAGKHKYQTLIKLLFGAALGAIVAAIMLLVCGGV